MFYSQCYRVELRMETYLTAFCCFCLFVLIQSYSVGLTGHNLTQSLCMSLPQLGF